MIKIKSLLIYFVLFCFGNKLNCQVANYIGNGSFENLVGNCNVTDLKEAAHWTSIDSINNSALLYSYCNGQVPNQFNTVYQLPLNGNVFAGSTFYYGNPYPSRNYLKNRLKKNLTKGETYCVKFYVNIMNTSPLGGDNFGIYFGNSTLDTIKNIFKPITYLMPQVKCQDGQPIYDTLGWTAVSGTFVANGDEKYAVIGIFKANNTIDTVVVNPNTLPLVFIDACIDDVSCIPIDLPAYAGPNKSCVVGDSVFIGRSPDVEINESCIWYKLNSNGTLSPPIDTIAGLYVKPIVTTAYVVRQQLWCSGVKWDTVVVYQDYVGLPKIVLNYARTDIGIYPQPADDYLVAELVEATTTNYYMSIVNNFGQVIREEEIIFKNKKAIISTKDLENGVYVLRIKSAENLKQSQYVSGQDEVYIETASKKFVIRR